MNTAALNTFAVNSDVLDSFQRSAVVATVVAQVYADPRVYRKPGALALPVQASVTANSRALMRSAASVVASATLTDTIRSYTTSPVAFTAAVNVVATGASYTRGYVRVQQDFTAQAAVSANPRVHARSVTVVPAEASIYAVGRSYTKVRSATVIQAAVDVWSSVGVYQRIPFVDNAVDERSIVVPYEGRTAVVV